MSEIQETDVYIKPDGTVELRMRGVKGTRCLTDLRKLEEQLGNQVVDRQLTDEYYEPPEEHIDDHLRQQRG
jgi:hypothetical protein